MHTQEFFNLLEENPDKIIRFEYENNKFVEANYHITEVKNVKIDSVDCGGNKNSWNETIIQLWIPYTGNPEQQISTTKALHILNTVDSIEPIDKDSLLFFEYGNDKINVSNFKISSVNITNKFVNIHFTGISTQCKASETCGTSKTSSCCSPSTTKSVCC